MEKTHTLAWLGVVLLAAAASSTSALPSAQEKARLPASVQDTLRVVPVVREFPPPQPQQSELVETTKFQADLCPLCIHFTEQAIDQLLNIILNGGVVGTCSKLCNVLANKTGSPLIGAACNILCDVVGIEGFIKLIEKADLDPIFLCEELKTCPIFDGGDAFITKITVTPQSGPQGQKNISFDYMSRNGTGTGEIIVEVKTVDGIPVESGFLQEPLKPGNYSKSLTLKAEPDPNCDPTQGPCEKWLPGNYTVDIAICNGECGSKHPHSQIYDTKKSVFVIT